MLEVFKVFLKLGLTSFGGPVAHLGYFRLELVKKRKWLSEDQFAQLLALCQFLPGPASSQLGFSLGLVRAGIWGAITAFAAFTLPSALLLIYFANLLSKIPESIQVPAVHGLKLVALVVVAHGLIGMFKKLCPDVERKLIALLSALPLLIFANAWIQILVVLGGAFLGLAFCNKLKEIESIDLPSLYSKKIGAILISVFFLLLISLPILANLDDMFIRIANTFYQAGALVFGGGHVVLPLLEQSVVDTGFLSSDKFLAGYGAAQAVPGPMFSFSSYLGFTISNGTAGYTGAFVALITIFLPGFLLLLGILPFWKSVSMLPKAKQAIAGVNASVVGILGAALYDPIWTSSVKSIVDLGIAIIGFILLRKFNIPSILIVTWCVFASFLIFYIS